MSNSILKVCNVHTRKSSRPQNIFRMSYLLKNLDEICDLSSFWPGIVYTIYLGKNYRIRDIRTLYKEYIFPEDIEDGTRAIVFFERYEDPPLDDSSETGFLLQEKALFNHSPVDVLDFIICNKGRCRSLQKKLNNMQETFPE